MSCSQYEDPVYIDGVPCKSLHSIAEAIRANPYYIDGIPCQRSYNYGSPKAEEDGDRESDGKWQKDWDCKDALKEPDESAPPEDGPSIIKLAEEVEDLAGRVEKLTKLLHALSSRIDECRRVEERLALRLYFLEPNRTDGSRMVESSRETHTSR